MKFKKIEKKDPLKNAESLETKKVIKDPVLKEEIREIVEETVEEILHEKTEKAESITPETKPLVIEATDTVLQDKTPEEKIDEPTINEIEISAEEKVATISSSIDANQPVAPSLDDQKSKQAEAEFAVSPPPAVTVTSLSNTAPETNNTSEDISEVSSQRSPLLRVLLVIVVLLLLGGLGYWYVSSDNKFSLAIPGMPTAQETPSPKVADVIPTSLPKEIDISKPSLSVLNGSGIVGEAAKVKATLVDAGFTVVTTGNADTSSATDTVISAKSEVEPEYLSKLREALGETYIVSEDTDKLADSESADVVVTIGSSTK